MNCIVRPIEDPEGAVLCFDEWDSCDDRRYWNFVFARTPEELEHKMEMLAHLRGGSNYNKLEDDPCAELLPMAYWGGDDHNEIIVKKS